MKIKVCQREAVRPRGEKKAEKGETWHRNSKQRVSPTAFQACPLSLTGLSKLKRLFWDGC